MKVLVTGITGTLGSHLLPLLLADGHKVVGYSRDELKQSQIPAHPMLTMYLGDVRNSARLVEASRDCDLIFHLAALKRVETLEENPEEGIATNIDGTSNVLHAQRVNKIPRVVLASTDKACHPINTYGMTKAVAERLVSRNANNVICRYGNVIASRGSVIPQFVASLQKEGKIYLTHPLMTRFWIEPERAADFVWRAGFGPAAGLRMPEIKAYPVLRMGKIIADILDTRKFEVVEIPMRPGEKIHETLRLEEEGGLLASGDRDLWFTEKAMNDLIRKHLGLDA